MTELYDRHRHGNAVIDFFQTGLGWPLHRGLYPDILRIPETYEAFWIRQREGQVIAALGLQRWSEGTALLRRLYVLPSVRGRGIGVHLLATALAYAREREYKTVWLWLSPDATPDVHRLYEHFRFEVVATLPVANVAGKICMELRL